MSPRELGPLLVEREFVFTDPTGRSHVVIMRLGVPVQEGEDWTCQVEVKGGGLQGSMSIFGVDKLQAVLLALRYARTTIQGWAEHDGGSVTWLDAPQLGLPDDPPTELVLWQSQAARLLHEARTNLLSETVTPELRDWFAKVDTLLAGWDFSSSSPKE